MYHFVLEARPKEFMPIDINILLGNKVKNDYTSLIEIDRFTKQYTVNEIFDLIEKNNLVPEKYLDGKLEIINDNKYRFGILSKDDVYSIDMFLNDYIDNKQIMNKFYNIYSKYCADTKDMMQIAIDNKDISKILNILFHNSYDDVRRIYIYILEKII